MTLLRTPLPCRTRRRTASWTRAPGVTALLALGAVAALLAGAPAARAEQVVPITGHGYGHGRGMGQFGALGYAVDRGWTHRQILEHFYGGTVAGTVPDLPVSVELLGQRGRPAVLTAPGLRVNGTPTGSAAVLVERSASGALAVRTGPGCAGPWTPFATVASGLVVSSAVRPEVELCQADRLRGYRGDLQVVLRSDGASALLNRLLVETYLRGVVPRESPASWADLGGGRGAQALRAQSVAARSYALAVPYAPYATTCDSVTCQVYDGAWTRPFSSTTRTPLEDPRTDAAVAATAGQVRRSTGGAVVRTEFSASTGGWSAPGRFPAVQDLGDAYAGNPHRNWSTSLSFADLSARLGVGELTGLVVRSRNGLGADGGRVTAVVADTTSGPVTLSGPEVRLRLGLRSDWFSVSTRSYAQSQSLARALYADLLQRPPSSQELAVRAQELAAGRPVTSLAGDVAASLERAGLLVTETYAGALRRSPGAAERDAWSRSFLSTGSLVELRAGVYGSPESLAVAGGLEPWVGSLYRGVLGREASAQERTFWAAEARRRGQPAVVRDVAGSSEALGRRLDVYYARMLQRTPDSGAGGFLVELRTRGEITVPVAIAGSPEYAAKAAARFPE